MQYSTAIFDLDGTLLDTLEDLWHADNHALTAFGLPTRSIDEVRRFVGNGLINLVRRSVPEGTDEQRCQEILAELNRHYAVHCEDHTGPYPGVIALLERLRAAGMQVAVVSNKGDYAVQELMPHYFGGLYDACVGEREGIRRKPAPDSVWEVMRQLDAPAEDCVYIGDSDVDVDTARASGIPCISVTWGFRSREFLMEHGATTFVDTPEELAALLLG
jgi:phosphoglycolate phosphatase